MLELTSAGSTEDMLISLDLRGAPSDMQHDYWQQVSPASYRVGRVPNGNGLDLKSKLWVLDDIVASQFSASAHRIDAVAATRGRGRAPYVKVRVYEAGHAEIQEASGPGQYLLRPGDVHFIDQSRPWSARYARHSQKTLIIPHALIGYRPSEHPIARTIKGKTPAGRILNYSIKAYYASLEKGVADNAGLLAALEAALNGALGVSRRADVRAATITAMRRFALETPISQDVSAESVARDFGVSRASVFRAFADDGGLGRFRLGVKLDRAHDALAGQPQRRGHVSELASEMGFSSTAHFSDAFQNRFGVRPSEASKLIPSTLVPDLAPVNDPNDLEDTLRWSLKAIARTTG
ncbi:helix-turn-helix domain-containing protein [Sulfitobacter sp. JBTF-M27]|uniref:Helix-turn-helix domain-containing protein n=2 Tax=Sulfitobacter sediminilitoris TaxID=2698830 RepID=A0A6P0C839_9RHOB|nr:AraC family transcriptional regulator [Sulfitobacter sediminilitoris]NEK22302.1 helix-turn-helix domain-containing protein [Sulfitobacter sediminilitoris]